MTFAYFFGCQDLGATLSNGCNRMHPTAHFLSQAIQHCPSPDNSQPWKLSWQGNALTVTYDIQRVTGKTFAADSHATLLTIGALSENLTQAAAMLDLKLNWTIPKLLDIHHPVYFQTTIEKQSGNTITPTTDSLPLFKRHTNRHSYRNKPLPGDCISLLKNLTQDSARILVFEDKPLIQQIAELVRSASEIRFQTQEVHEWLAKSLRFDTKNTDQYGEGLDVATIDLPPGGRLFLRLISDWQRMNRLNKLGAYKAMALIDSQPVGKAPALIAVVGPTRFRDTLAAGKLMNRAWIALNEQGIAVHPYYVVADQLQRRQANIVPSRLTKQADAVFDQARQLFQFGDGETLHMLFRVGYPIKTPVKSKRLPLEAVCSGIELDTD